MRIEDYVAIAVMMEAYDLWNLMDEEYAATRLTDLDVVRGYIQLLSAEELSEIDSESINAARVASSAIVINGYGDTRDANVQDIQLLYNITGFLNVLYEKDDCEPNIH